MKRTTTADRNHDREALTGYFTPGHQSEFTCHRPSIVGFFIFCAILTSPVWLTVTLLAAFS